MQPSKHTHHDFKFDFFQRKKIEHKPKKFFDFIRTLDYVLILLFVMLNSIYFLKVSAYLKEAPIREYKLQIYRDKQIISLFTSLESKSLGESQLILNDLREFNSIETNNKTMDLFLNNPIYEKNTKKYSPEYKMMVSSYLLSIKNDISLEVINLHDISFYKNSWLLSFKQNLLNKKFSDSYSKYQQETSKFETSYLRLISNIDDPKLRLVLNKKLDNVVDGFNKNLKDLTPSD